MNGDFLHFQEMLGTLPTPATFLSLCLANTLKQSDPPDGVSLEGYLPVSWRYQSFGRTVVSISGHWFRVDNKFRRFGAGYYDAMLTGSVRCCLATRLVVCHDWWSLVIFVGISVVAVNRLRHRLEFRAWTMWGWSRWAHFTIWLSWSREKCGPGEIMSMGSWGLETLNRNHCQFLCRSFLALSW